MSCERARSRLGVSIAVTVGLYSNNADAYIAGNATVDAGGAITVDAKALNAFDPNSTFGTNLAAAVPVEAAADATRQRTHDADDR